MKERREDEEEDFSGYRMVLRKGEDTKNWIRNTRSYSVENSFWKRLWTCRNTTKWIKEWVDSAFSWR